VTAPTSFGGGPARPSGRRVFAVSAVLLGHLAILLLVWQWKLGAGHKDNARRAIPIRLIPLGVLGLPTRTDDAPVRARPPLRLQRVAAPQPAPQPALSEPVSATSPSGATGGAQALGGQDAAVAAAPGMAASAPLALTPNRGVLLGALSNPAIDDPRSNTPKPTFEERIAMALDPELCIKLERLPDGTVRRRMSRLVNAQSAIQNSHGTGPHGIKVCQ
jgi:hypothetical protein